MRKGQQSAVRSKEKRNFKTINPKEKKRAELQTRR
jgi:hypothetical protein